jgi:hypothetical protein
LARLNPVDVPHVQGENQVTDPNITALAKLRVPFPPEQIGKLPKGGMQLDFVGHGFITARLLDVDPTWNWEPVALDTLGLPLLDEFGGLWIRLTVCGVTRLGYGDAGGRKGPNAVKEAIGDALRNAGMRFGLALDLWSKGDPDAAPPPVKKLPPHVAKLAQVAKQHGLDTKALGQRFLNDYGVQVTEADPLTVEAFTQLVADEAAVDEAAAG